MREIALKLRVTLPCLMTQRIDPWRSASNSAGIQGDALRDAL